MTREEISDRARARASAVAYMREQGMTYAVIGAKVGISVSRAQQLYKRHVRNTAHLCRRTKDLTELLKQIT
jgi:hypothetical protein